MNLSFSAIGTFQQCPHKFKLKYIDKIKVPFETNIALEKGKYIHSVIENKLKNKQVENFEFTLSKENDIKEYNEIIFKFINSPLFSILTEGYDKIAIEEGFSIIIEDRKLKALNEYKNNALLKGFIDFYGIKENKMNIIDWKTGKFKEDQNMLQVIIYSVWGFLNYPNIDEINTYYVFVEHEKHNMRKFKREELDDLIKIILKEIANIKNAKRLQTFNKRVSKLCDWCEFKKFGHCNGEYDIVS